MKNKKIILKTTILVIIFLLSVLPTKVNAENFWDKIFSWGDNFIQDGSNPNYEIEIDGKKENINIGVKESALKSASDGIFNVLFSIGVALTVIIGGILGIQFMIASADEKAKIKEAIVPYILGCIVIYGAFGIWKLALEIVQDI